MTFRIPLFPKFTFPMACLLLCAAVLCSCQILEKKTPEPAVLAPGEPLFPAKLLSKNLNYRIMIPENASAVQKTAAWELEKYLKKLYTKPVSLNGKIPSLLTFYVGDSRDSVNAGFQPQITGKEFCIRGSGNAVMINGADDPKISPTSVRGRTGTLLGVYYFLSRYAGATFFAIGPRGEKFNLNQPLRIGELDSPVPSYEARVISFGTKTKGYSYQERVLFFKKMLCYEPVYSSPDFYFKVPDFKSRPDLWATYDGKKFCGSNPCDLPCLSHPEVLKIMTEEVFKQIKKRGGVCHNVRIFVDTSYKKCECPRCAGFRNMDEYFYSFINRLAGEIHKKYPEAYVMTQEKDGYYFHYPYGMKLEPNMVMEIRSGLPGRGFEMQGSIAAWRKAGAKTIIRWYPRVGFHWFDYPIVNAKNIGKHLKAMQGKIDGTRWCDGDSVCLAQSALVRYIQARFLFDASLDVDGEIARFCSLAYPGAEQEMIRYYDLMERNHYSYTTWGNALQGALQYDNLIEPVKILDSALVRVRDPFWLKPLADDLKRVQKLSLKYRDQMAEFNSFGRIYENEFPRSTVFKAVRLENAPVLTGKISDEVWKKVPGFTLRPVVPLNTPFRDSLIRLAHDGNTLYCAFLAREDQPEKISAGTLDPQGKKCIWSDDTFELMIAPPDRDFPYLQFAVNAKGDCLVLFYTGRTRYRELHIPLLCKGGIDLVNRNWTNELAIPMELLRGICKNGRARIGVFRSRNLKDKAGENQNSALFTGAGNTHIIRFYRPLVIR